MLATVEAFKSILPNGFNPTIHRVTAEGDAVVAEWEGNAVPTPPPNQDRL